jgi:PAS domain S-box-containing protein
MSWLALGVLYSAAYATVGWFLRENTVALSWFRAAALLVPPMTGTLVIVWRRQTWGGCQWLFWATIALGLTMSAIGLTGWAVDELVFGRMTWLAWPSVFVLFGSVAPLFALLAQPHRGPREPLAATTAVDIAGLAVVTGFLYSFFITSPDIGAVGPTTSMTLRMVSELQQFIVVLGMGAAMYAARRSSWYPTYRRLALGALVSFITLTLSNIETRGGEYRSGFVYDFVWILPFAFYPWAASFAPASDADGTAADQDDSVRPRPWVIFTTVALLPFLDFGLRRVAPQEDYGGFRDLSTAVAIISVLPLLVARIAAERAELQRAGGTMRLLAQVLEQAQELILILTPDGHCRHANDAFCRAVGLPRERLTTLSAKELLAGASISPSDILDRVRKGRVWRGTLNRTRGDGSSFPVAASVAALVDERGRPTHLVSVERDISEERRLREQLIHSERLSAVGQLVAGVAHEINNPLQSVAGYAELLAASDVSPAVKRDLALIRRDAQRAATIVRHLLAFARRSTLERSVADLNEIVRSTIDLRSFQLRTADVQVTQELADGLPLIVANREEIQQVVLNLVVNAEQAIKATGARGGAITVRTASEGGNVHVDVIDTGIGVSAGNAGRIFEPFFTTKQVGEGTGLGLSVSLGIAQAHGGTLELVPSARGAQFRLTLPASSSMHIDLPAAEPTSAAVDVRF